MHHKSLYNSICLVLIIFSLILSNFYFSNRAFSESDDIRECKKSDIESLKSLHLNDISNRLRIGQTLEYMSSDLMIKLNSRLTSNKIDTANLIKISMDFNSNFQHFRESYISYDNLFEEIINKKCKYDYYDDFLVSLKKLKDSRKLVYSYLLKIYQKIDDYKNEVKKIEKNEDKNTQI